MKELIKCYSNKDIKKAEAYFYKKWYRYLTNEKYSKFRIQDIDNRYKKEIYVLYDG